MGLSEQTRELLRKRQAEAVRLRDLTASHLMVAADWLEETHPHLIRDFNPSTRTLVYLARVPPEVKVALVGRLPYAEQAVGWYDYHPSACPTAPGPDCKAKRIAFASSA